MTPIHIVDLIDSSNKYNLTFTFQKQNADQPTQNDKSIELSAVQDEIKEFLSANKRSLETRSAKDAITTNRVEKKREMPRVVYSGMKCLFTIKLAVK